MVKFKDECLEKNVAVHLRTMEHAVEFMCWYRSETCLSEDDIKKQYADYRWFYVYGNNTCFLPHGGSYSDRGFCAKTGCRILSYEEALLEEEYSTPVIDPSKYKKYHVWDDDFGRTQNFIRYGVCIIGNRLCCVNDKWEQEFLNGETPHLVKWDHWEEIKEDENKEVKEQISRLKAELEKLEGIINEQ